MRPTRSILAAGLAAATALATALPSAAAVPTDSSQLREAVSAAGIMEHLEAFQAIADANGGTRLAGTPGYDESADYVAGLLTAAGYQVTRQQFTFDYFQEIEPPLFERVSPTPRTYVETTDFLTMTYSGSGDVTAPIFAVDLVLPPGPVAGSSTSGCETSDFVGFPAGSVALLQRGTCDFVVKATNAEAAGASAVIIFNEGQEGRTDVFGGTLGGLGVTIPVLGTSFAVGAELAGMPGAVVHIRTVTLSETRLTENILADTPTGRVDRTVVVGAHLDSVAAGPGINDNGSGAGALLEIALQMAELNIEPRNRVRFAFWGAEEEGLLGSEYYVSQLSTRDIKNTALNLNFDMIASPNYVRFVYDGDGSDTETAGPNGSGQIEDVFTKYFASQGLPTEPTAFDGRSDYGPFIAVGIPAGGLFTGAEGIKTPEEAVVYGGVAGAPYDPCYHEVCDSLTPTHTPEDAALFAQLALDYDLVGNVNLDALEEMADATAHATLTYAMTTSAVQGTSQSSTSASAALEHQGSQLKR
ncbi:M20/M25/M40 family metallo-hydrolase [Actinophytocola sp.]|uniref:M20/M25/M40 family metallo-hydrolase n=1 Tax=Actinophytocola sp. TaxID=1872138 RepID=UPI002ED01CA9